jgi:hypothetical protein
MSGAAQAGSQSPSIKLSTTHYVSTIPFHQPTHLPTSYYPPNGGVPSSFTHASLLFTSVTHCLHGLNTIQRFICCLGQICKGCNQVLDVWRRFWRVEGGRMDMERGIIVREARESENINAKARMCGRTDVHLLSSRFQRAAKFCLY